MSEYRKRNDLLSYTEGTIKKNVGFNIVRSTPYTIISFDLGYLEGSQITLKYEDVLYDIDFKIDTQTQQETSIYYDCNLAENIALRWLVKSSNKTYELISIIYNAPDEFALKSELNETSNLLDTYARNHQDLAELVGQQYVQIMEQQTKISNLEQRLLALEKANDPDSEWKEYYSEFTEKASEELASYFAYDYGTESKTLNLWNTNIDGDAAPAGEYLLILHDKDMKKHFIRMISQDDSNYTVYFDEVYLHENAPSYPGPLDGIDLNIDNADSQSFDEVYRKV